MTSYVDQYFDAGDATAFLELLASAVNLLGPQPGIAAVAERVDDNGQIIAARPALGDPARVYIAVRSENSPPVPAGAAFTNPDLARAILGVWA